MYYYKSKNLITLLLNFNRFVFFKNYIAFLLNYFLNYNKIKAKKISFLNSVKFDKNKYTQDWFSKHAYFIDTILNKNLNKYPFKILEVGSYEGLSANFFLQRFKLSTIDVVDTFKGGKEQIGVKDFKNLKLKFLNNTKKNSKKIKIFSMKSSNFYSKYHNKKYDLIYIDGSHHYKDVFTDAQNSLKILNQHGIIIFDDYFWKFYQNNKNPKDAIDKFYEMNSNKIKLIGLTSQIFFKKIF